MSVLDSERPGPSLAWQIPAAILSGVIVALAASDARASYVAGGLFCVLLLWTLLQRPDIGLPVVLFVRAFTDLSIGPTGMQNMQLAGVRSLSPNGPLVLALIVGGGAFLLSRRARLFGLPGAAPLGLLLLTGFVGMLQAPSLLLGVREWLQVLSGLVAYGLAAYLFRTPRRLQRVIDVLAVTFVIPAAVGLAQFAGGARTYFLAGIGVSRIYGTFVHPNAFGMFLIVFFAVFLCQFLAQRGTRKIVALAIVGVAGVLILLTYARFAWAGAVVVLLVVGALSRRPLLVGATLLILFAGALSPQIAGRAANPLGGSFADRVNIWTSTFPVWAADTHDDASSVATVLNRLRGLGPGTIDFLTTQALGAPMAAHDDYLAVLFQYGIAGLAAFLVMFFMLARFAYRTWRACDDATLAALPLSLLALTLAFVVMSTTDNIFGSTQNQLYFWTVAGLAVAVRGMARAPSPGTPRRLPEPAAAAAPAGDSG